MSISNLKSSQTKFIQQAANNTTYTFPLNFPLTKPTPQNDDGSYPAGTAPTYKVLVLGANNGANAITTNTVQDIQASAALAVPPAVYAPPVGLSVSIDGKSLILKTGAADTSLYCLEIIGNELNNSIVN